MNDFTAPNGLKISRLDGDGLRVAIPPDGYEGWQKLNLHASTVIALREFLQAEADERLGRWRWPKDPRFLVYRESDDRVLVMYEPGGGSTTWTRAEVASGAGSDIRDAAAAYFDAHPEPKPWDEANEGEIWALTGAGGLEQPWRRHEGKWISCTPSLRTYDAAHAIAGRCIWSEASDGD